MRFGRAWAFLHPYGDPPFATHFEDRDGVVGRRFFRDLAEETGAELQDAPGAGIVASLDDLAHEGFDPGKVDPVVREIYEHTSATSFHAQQIDWQWYGWAWHFLYNRFVARGMRQLNVPIDEGFLPRKMTSSVGLLDEDRDGSPDYRIWVRIFQGADQLFYVGAVKTHEQDGPRGRQAYLDVVLPLFHSNLAVVFEPVNVDGGGLLLRTRHPNSYHGGMYLVFPGGRRFSMMPAWGVHEEIKVEPMMDREGNQYVRGTHENWWMGLHTYTLYYELHRTNAADATMGRAHVRRAGAGGPRG